MNFLHRWDITFHWISFQCNSLRFPDITSHCPMKLCFIITDCVYLYFVLLSELEHFGLLSQYYQPLGSWSALLVSSFLLVTTRLARQRGVTFSLDRCFLFFLQLSLSFFLFLLSFLFSSFFFFWTSSRLFWMGGCDLVGDTWQLPRRLPFYKTARSYLVFVSFFTQAKLLENKIYTEKTRKLRQNAQKIAIFLCYYGKIHS